ncbi:putative protein OS=Tsukamurella paurometabola (strain ATCC 8368 / DSM / CCUG 35730 /CIP 100753 / JCM 10117 / KCTC 9821 / NBRC 16120 / NCIMB 702349/ NCTC 13040) OX=521096 GN=Tpau_0250 PE=4 SV=1 [Tsukamurella paurometabola]|uniref:Uncharacterized protein n=1 Tax=Tsukamurella paurometabola (strain ATCC 8368 / DSM 20162 / CCUG 35730 / CIP 100753 / JCM 10117 / KCTC 9821 / NBRC 16120 / NCIMB 702349 / NCTC 13040) TaxID=521096 RepID=D5UQR7_TSUPD|nr:hypothetical protein [Tsukamurella paurometabola]ADG76900.1 hypothetical protein Tpau_0250 [Tsukamurella paurometabola DSM 20162]SUP42137.1 Uncharacterised protein [Tsukamurella paurometabola]
MATFLNVFGTLLTCWLYALIFGGVVMLVWWVLPRPILYALARRGSGPAVAVLRVARVFERAYFIVLFPVLLVLFLLPLNNPRLQANIIYTFWASRELGAYSRRRRASRPF